MAEANKGRGCFFYGCLTPVIVTILGIIGIYFTVRYVAKQTIAKYTSTNGVAIAPVTLPRERGREVTQRIDNFKTALRAGQATGPLELSSEELDFYIRNSEGWAHMRDHLHVAITNNQIEAQISFPLEAMHPSLKGRFLNGTAEFEPKVQNGVLSIDLKSVKARGTPVPEKFLKGFRQSMSVQPSANDPNAELIRNLESLEVKDDKILLTPKVKMPEAKTN